MHIRAINADRTLFIQIYDFEKFEFNDPFYIVALIAPWQ